MTTTILLRHRTPLEPLSMSQQTKRRTSKRVADYNEEDDGFQFSRGSKRTKTSTAPPEAEPAILPSRSKQSKSKHDGATTEKSKPHSRRQMNFSTPGQDTKQQPRQGTRRSARLSTGEMNNVEDSRNDSSMDCDSINMVGESTPQNNFRAKKGNPEEPTKITLPFSDTPVINRNKELRKTNGGRRRSSLGLRGRRASSLIDSGHSALPHSQVEASQFYKHIEAEGLSEPRRMKQLLIWCGERALGTKPAHNHPDSVPLLSARIVQEAILKAFSTNSEMSDWFARDAAPKPTVVKKPHPLDALNAAKVQELEARIKRLKAERDQWKQLQKPPAALSPLLDPSNPCPAPTAIDVSLLSPEDATILESLKAGPSSSLLESIKQRLASSQQGLEFKVDRFAHGVHEVSQARQTMDRVAEKVMALSATRLDEREKAEREAVGTRDLPIQEVLRSLSRIIPNGRQ